MRKRIGADLSYFENYNQHRVWFGRFQDRAFSDHQ